MKRVFFLALIFIYLLGNTEIIQLIRLPMIFVHYQNHLKDNDKLDLFYFINSHYGESGDGINSDNTEENQMPFMYINHHISTIAIFSLSKLNIIPPVFKPLNTNYAEYLQSYTPDVYSLSLLRPPIFIS
jgi:hypothetical protein